MRPKPFVLFLIALFCLLPRIAPARAEEIAIGSFDELRAFSEQVARGELTDARVFLTADIRATKPLRAIGTARHMFRGEFDGRGHTISRLVVFAPSGSQGLFGCVAPEGVVKNLSLDRAFVAGPLFKRNSLFPWANWHLSP